MKIIIPFFSKLDVAILTLYPTYFYHFDSKIAYKNLAIKLFLLFSSIL